MVGPGQISMRTLVWVDRQGREEPLPAPVRAYEYPRLSPDGTRIAINLRDQEQDIWIWDLARETLTRLTFDPAVDQYPLWSPDSRRLFFASQRAGAANLYQRAADGTGDVERLTENPTNQFPYAFTPDGTEIVFRQDSLDTGTDLMQVPLQPPGTPQPLVGTMFSERNAELAPDGAWLAYESNESGREEIYVQPFPDVDGGKWQISTDGGRLPLWSRDGQELFYASPEGVLMGARVEPGSLWRNGTPVPILQGEYPYGVPPFGRTFDIAPDGERFLMLKEGAGGDSQEDPPNRFIVVENWFEELRQRVPVP